MNGTNWRDFVDSIHELEAYQKKVRKGYVKDRNQYTQTGPQKSGGAPFDQDPPKTRSKSAPPGFGGALEEEVEPESFDTHDTLEPHIWEGEEIKPQIRKKLLKIAKDFISGLPVPVKIKDVTLTGSLANYNWSNYSDVDLHIIVDFLDIDENFELVKSFFDNARMKWNNEHDIKMKGYDVEIYVENEGESHKSSGLFSLLNNDWIKRPKKYRNNIDFTSARRKAEDIEFQVNIISNLITARKYKLAMKNIDRIKKKIKNMRRAGLESPLQEFSVENIAFKILRRNDTLGFLNDLKKRAYDDMMSVKEETNGIYRDR
jgi:predicted nucleotidyltransferase